MNKYLQNLSIKQATYVFLFCGFLLYGNTLLNDYTLDDAIVITENQFTTKGISGIWDQLTNDQFTGFYGEQKSLVSGGRYRPLSLVVFNIEYALWGDTPLFYHLFSILWYCLNGLLLYLLLKKLLPGKYQTNQWVYFPLFISLLWFFHPIHTEVVANIKGRDEIMAFTGLLASFLLLLKYLEERSIKNLLLFSLLYFLSLLSKENSITFLAIFPLGIYFFKSEKLKAAVPIFIASFITAGIWFAIRYEVIGGGISAVADNLMNDPFLNATESDKYATIVYTLGKYISLLFFPHPLTFDYYPKQIPIVSWSNSMVLLSVFSYLLLTIITIWGFFKKNIIAFGILFFGITLSVASNIFFPIGTFMNERFVYISSLGFAIILAYFLVYGIQQFIKNKKAAKQVFTTLSLVVFILYSVKTISRNRDWKNNFTLATHDSEISVNGAKSNVMAGGLLLEKAKEPEQKENHDALLNESIEHLQRALQIYPQYIDALLLMGNAQWEFSKTFEPALEYYKAILAINPNHQGAWENILYIGDRVNGINQKVKGYESLLKLYPNKPELYLKLGRVFGQELGDIEKAIWYFHQGLELAPNSYELYSNLGTSYGLQNNYLAALDAFKKAVELAPNIAKAHIDLGLTYHYMGQDNKAKAEFDQAKLLDPSIDRTQFPV